MGKSSKNNYYLSFDINTKDPNFYSNIYSDIKSFMIENNFLWRKDSNYLTKNEISLRQFHKIQKQFCKEFFNNLSCISKMDVSIHQKEMSISFIKSINKTIYSNLSKQKTKSYSKQKPQEQDNEMEM